MGIGFLAALFSISLIREFVGGGTILSGIQSLLPFLSGSSFNGVDVASAVSQYTALEPIKIFILPAGGFMVFGFLMALVNRINHKRASPRWNSAAAPAKPAIRRRNNENL